jgi:hypothetical protein
MAKLPSLDLSSFRFPRIWVALGAMAVILGTLPACGEVLGPKYPDPVIEEPGKDKEEDDG